MPALAIPIGAPFEVAPDKVTEFLEFSRKMNSREITESRLKKMNAQVQFISKKKQALIQYKIDAFLIWKASFFVYIFCTL